MAKSFVELRNAKFLSQQDLAAKASVSSSLIQKIESGTHTNVGGKRLLSLASVLEVDPAELKMIIESGRAADPPPRNLAQERSDRDGNLETPGFKIAAMPRNLGKGTKRKDNQK